ncbi:MAG: tetratricopeptide repeat protein [Nitrospira sp.]|nr:tetratricopeptide repeat protein [Candidatus Manganitrophaceae bacterium]HIL35118.1 tetratricopeptide repeat protein [Candidatus Manganitrophaceae bacterium]
MKRLSMRQIGLFLIGVISVVAITACSGGGSPRVQIPSLMSPGDMSNRDAAAKNNEGVDHLVQGHYDIALKHFKKALAAAPNFAEAHFNMAISLDGMGKHADATEAFKKAKNFGGDNPKIVDNAVLKKHLNL